MPEINIPFYPYKFGKGFESKAELTEFPISDQKTVRVQRIIIKKSNNLPLKVIGLIRGYPTWKEISNMELWSEDEIRDFCTIIIEYGFDQNSDLPDGSMQFSQIGL